MPEDRVHPSGAVYATWGSRAIAEIVDGLILIPVTIVLFAIGLHGPVRAIAGGLATLVYNGMLDGGPDGQTVGKRAMRIRTVSADTGAVLGTERGFQRAVLPLAFGVIGLLGPGTFLIGLIGNLADDLWPLWDPQRQTLHDKVAGSIVVKV
jgi:uncharacterized RDD family membrane protein YckC